MFDSDIALPPLSFDQATARVLASVKRAVVRDCSTLGELNVLRLRLTAELTAAQARNDRGAEAVASRELTRLDQAIGTVLANLALRNADIARLRQVTA